MSRGVLVARRNAMPTTVKGEKFFAPNQCERLLSRTAAKQERLTVPATTEPTRYLTHRVGNGAKSVTYPVFRESQCSRITQRKSRPPETVDLLVAIFAVNRSAKRYRDAAQALYQANQHGFAGDSRKKKETLYELKERGIAAAVRQGRLSYVGMNGRLALYRGDGYCFHSTIVPATSPNEQIGELLIFREACPRGATEARLKDAVSTLKNLPENAVDAFSRLSSPCRSESRSVRQSARKSNPVQGKVQPGCDQVFDDDDGYEGQEDESERMVNVHCETL